MEAIDRQIINLLCADGRMSLADIARETGLSTSALHQRVRRLEQRGLVTGYRAEVDYRAVGLPLTAFVSLTPIDPAAPDDVPDRLAPIPEIEACWSVAGAESYILKVRVVEPVDLELNPPRASAQDESIFQVIKGELFVGAISNVAGVGRSTLFGCRFLSNNTDSESQRLIERSLQFGVARGKIVIDGDHVYRDPGEGRG